MSQNAVVTVELRGNATSLSAALKGAQKQLLSFSNTIKAGFGLNIGAQLANGLLSLPGRFKAGIDSAVTFASQIDDLSKAAGLSTEAFQVLARQAKLSGAEMADVSKAIVAVGEKARDAIGGQAGAAGAFAQLGLDAKAFIQLAPERQMEVLGEAYSNAADKGAAFSALMEIMGTKQAPKLRAMLEQLGAQGLGKLSEDMAKAGLLMRKDVSDQLDEMGDKSEDLSTRFKNAWGDVAVAFKPVFDLFVKFGTWIADLMSFIARSLEKIGIAAGTIGAMAADLFSGDFKGFAFYDAAAASLSAQVDARGSSPLAGTTPAATDANAAGSKAEAKDELKAIQERVQRAQRQAAVELAAIGRSFTLTNDQKRAATVAVLRAEALAIEQSQQDLDSVIERLARADPRFAAVQSANPDLATFGVAAELSRGPAANKDLAGAIDARSRITDTQSGVTQGILGANQDPLSVAEGVDAALTQIEDRWGSLAGQMFQSISSIGDAITGGLANGMQQLLGTTEQWSQKLGNIAGPILGSITGAISKMFAEWIVGRAAAAAKNIALSIKESAAAAPGALFTSIKSFGVAAALGIAGFLAAKALTGGFFEGGFTGLGNPNDPAGIVHKGEFVIPHDVTSAIGPAAFAGLVESVRNPSHSFAAPSLTPDVISMAGNGAADAPSDEPWVQLPQTLFVDHRDQDLIDRVLSNPKFKTKVIRIGRHNTGDFGSAS